jgi:hypothetical protein
MRAALIYQHATAERDRAIAEALSELALAEERAPRACAQRVIHRTGSVDTSSDQGNRGAGDGNRTRMTSLEGCWTTPGGVPGVTDSCPEA